MQWQDSVCRHVHGFLYEITHASRRRLVGSHVHDALRHEREMPHGRARINLKKTQGGGRCGKADGDLCQSWDSNGFDQLDFSGCRGVPHSPGSRAVGARGYFSRELSSAEKGHSWSVRGKGLPAVVVKLL